MTDASAPRHPSAGNLGARPAVVRDGEVPAALPPGSFPHGADLATDVLQLGPDLDHESLTKLVGDVAGKRVLDLGCNGGAASLFFAERGAKVIAVDAVADRLGRARSAAERAGTHIELHHSDLAELAFVRADTVDLVVSVYALSEVDDLNRVFRQVHRVLRQEAPLLLSLPHPAGLLVDLEDDEGGGDPHSLARSYFERGSHPWRAGGTEGVTHAHTISDVFTALSRAGFRVDTLLEPKPQAAGTTSRHWQEHFDLLPPTLVIRARKQGI